jgi:hypothetical protein
MINNPRGSDFLKSHPVLVSFSLLLFLMIVGHGLWLVGVIPDNNSGGKILYEFIPFLWLTATVALFARNLLR